MGDVRDGLGDASSSVIPASPPVIPAKAGIQSSSPSGVGGGKDLEIDSGDWMFGYNAFFDYDITRGHQRGGLGLEAQYDWLKVAANYYAPLSGWKDSKDFDGNFVSERAAQGWDLRAKGYLPFYREIALTGAYTQWYGEHVGMFGPSKLEKDPKIWSYGLEYTPVPAVTAFVNQRQTERGRSDTEFGLRFTYHFGMDAEEQFKPSRVAEMRTVHGARHDFVDRENKIILEYKAKDKFYIDFVGLQDGNVFVFRLRNGFDKAAAGQMVRVTAGGAVTIAQSSVRPAHKQTFFAQALDVLDGLFSVRAAHADSGMSYTTDGDGKIYVRVNDPDKLTSLTISAGNSSQTYTRAHLGMGDAPTDGLSATSASIAHNASPTITLTGAAAYSSVTWEITSGDTLGSLSNMSSTTDVNGKATATLTAAATGTGNITVKATVAGKEYTCTVRVEATRLTIAASGGTGSFTHSTTATFEVTATLGDNPVTIGPSDVVTWTVETSSITAPWWGNRSAGALNGLTWGATPLSLTGTDAQRTAMVGTVPTGATAQLTDIVGSRTVTVKAVATIGGFAYPAATAILTFGKGPLAVFANKPVGSNNWKGAIAACGGTGDINSAAYQPSTKLPDTSQLQAVAGSGDGGRQGAAHAAGWPDDSDNMGSFDYWTGAAYGFIDNAGIVGLDDGGAVWNFAVFNFPVAVCLP